MTVSPFDLMRSKRPSKTDFGNFMLPYFEMLYARAYRLTGNVADAEDLVQELCIRVFPRLEEVLKVENPKFWLLRVLFRLFVDVRRRTGRSPFGSLSAVEDEESSLSLACPEPTPDEHVETLLTQRRLQRALRLLRPEDQALLILHEVEGYSLAELEEIADSPESTLKSRLHRARVKLGRLLSGDEGRVGPAPGDLSHELSRRRRSAG